MSTMSSAPVTSDWAGSPISTLHPLSQPVQSIPVEQYPAGSRYVVRLELPGIEPGPDLTVSVETGTLAVRAERHFSGVRDCESEFHYGTFARNIPLPADADLSDVSASYSSGILTVLIGTVPERQRGARPVPVDVQS